MGGEDPANSALILCAAVDHPQFKRSAALSDLARVCETIGKVRGHLEQRHVRTEADVRQYILNPVLPSLGWDAADPGTVRREYTVSSGQSHFQFDYALSTRPGRLSLSSKRRPSASWTTVPGISFCCMR